MSFFTSAPQINYSFKTLADEDDWKYTKYGYKGLLEGLSRTGQRIGKLSVFGKVERVSFKGNVHTFLIKSVPGVNNNRKHIFETEVKVGSKNNIEKVGPRILAYRYTPFGGEYIMDSVEMGNPNAKVFTFESVKRQIPLELVEGVIKDFHRITRGMHGDLHGDNILCVQVNGKTYVRIIDYGAFRTFDEIKAKGKPVKKHLGINAYNLGKGQKFMYNKNHFKRIRQSVYPL